MPEADQNEQQDLHVSRPHEGDISWARMQPIQIAPSQARLDADHQLVTIKNVSDVQSLPYGKPPKPQTHIVIDRFMVGHELQPGQRKPDIDMLKCDIEYFLRERAPNRLDNLGRPRPLHPIVIEGFNVIDAPRIDERRAEQARAEQQQAKAEQAKPEQGKPEGRAAR